MNSHRRLPSFALALVCAAALIARLQAQIPPPGAGSNPLRPPPDAAPAPSRPLPQEFIAFLREICAAYQSAKTYQDTGKVVIVQTTGKVKTTTEVPMRLTFGRPNLLHLDAGQYEAACDGKQLQFAVPSMKQFTLTKAPEVLERKNLPTGTVLGGADEGHPELLDFLTTPGALDMLLPRIKSAEWRPDEVIGGKKCRVLNYATTSGTTMTLYADAQRHLLLRAEGDAPPQAETPTQAALEAHIQLHYDFGEVRINQDIPPESFTLLPSGSMQRVSAIGENMERPADDNPQQPAASHLIGKPMPPISAVDLSGKAIGPEDFKSKTILLFFWGAQGSEHSLVAIPTLQTIADAFKERGDFLLLAINTDAEPKPLAPQILERKKAAFRCITDQDRTLRKNFGLAGVPTFLLIDKTGVMRWAKLGAPPDIKNVLMDEINKLLAPNGN